jgi:hypothetical protein
MITSVQRMTAVAVLQVLVVVSTAAAQSPDDSGLSRALQALERSVSGSGQFTTIDAERLFAGLVTARITNNDGDPDRIGATDCIDLVLAPRPGAHPTAPAPQRFVGPRTAAGGATCAGTQGSLDEWVRSDGVAPQLLRILFPGSLGAFALGRTPAELHAQQLLLTTALATEGVRRETQGGRSLAGGLIEFESLRRDGRENGDSGFAVQGLYGINRFIAVQGRYARQREFFTSQATTVSVDYHPFVEIDRGITWRLGGTARGGLLYSTSAAVDLGSFEFGGGGWASGFKQFGRVRVAGGSLLQASTSWVPGAFAEDGDDLDYLVDAINDRGMQYDLTFGGTGSVDTSEQTRVIVKLLENTPLSLRDERESSWQLSAGLSYRVGLPTLNVGYKFYSGTGLQSHSVFFQGNFDW